MLLTNITSKVTLTTSAAGRVEAHADFANFDGTTVTMGYKNSVTTAASTIDIVDVPAASTTRKVLALFIGNTHASVTNTVTIIHTDGTTPVQFESLTLAPGERMVYRADTTGAVIDALGRPRTATAPAATAQVLALTDQALAATDTYITGSAYPFVGRLQAGSTIRWTMTMTKTAAGVVAPIWNIRFGTAGAIGDLARCTMTGVAQTAAIDTARVEISAVVRTLGASGIVQATMGGDHLLATTGFSVGGFANQVTSGAFDLTVANTKAGISVVPGTAAAWTVKTCIVEGIYLLG